MVFEWREIRQQGMYFKFGNQDGRVERASRWGGRGGVGALWKWSVPWT